MRKPVISLRFQQVEDEVGKPLFHYHQIIALLKTPACRVKCAFQNSVCVAVLYKSLFANRTHLKLFSSILSLLRQPGHCYAILCQLVCNMLQCRRKYICTGHCC